MKRRGMMVNGGEVLGLKELECDVGGDRGRWSGGGR